MHKATLRHVQSTTAVLSHCQLQHTFSSCVPYAIVHDALQTGKQRCCVKAILATHIYTGAGKHVAPLATAVYAFSDTCMCIHASCLGEMRIEDLRWLLSQVIMSMSVMQVHDRMTEQVYSTPLKSFATDVVPTPVFTVPIMEQGTAALEQINEV